MAGIALSLHLTYFSENRWEHLTNTEYPSKRDVGGPGQPGRRCSLGKVLGVWL
jgi:hypothetical protein